MLFFSSQSCRGIDECRTDYQIKNIISNFLWKQGSHNAGLLWKQIQGIWHANSRAIVSILSSLPIPVAINTAKWNCSLGNMDNVLHLLGDTECEDFFRMNMDKHWSWFHQKFIENNNRWFCINTSLFDVMQTVFVHLFGYSIISFRKLTFDEWKVVVKKC